MEQKLDLDLPVRLMADGRPFDEVITALEDMLRRAHKARNYGAIVLLEGSRVSILSQYGRPAAEQASALDAYVSMQPDPISCAAKALTVCVNCPELIERYIPAAIAALSEISQEPGVAELLTRLRELHTSSPSAS
jgi:hypothetical protein